MARDPRLIVGTQPETLPWWLRWLRILLPLPRLTLSGSDLASHKHLLGASGTGKTSLIVSLMYQMIRQGIGFCLIDPLGAASEQLMELLLANGFWDDLANFDRLWYVPFSDREQAYFPAMNINAKKDISSYTKASQFAEACYRLWPNLEGAVYFENAVKYGVKLLASADLPVTALEDVLRDRAFRDPLLSQFETDPDVHAFFRALDAIKDERQREERIVTAAVRSQILKFEPGLKNTLGQARLLIDPDEVIRSNRWLIIPTHDVHSDDARRMIQSLLAVGFEYAALRRSGFNLHQYHLLLEEMSESVQKSGESLERMLSKTRNFSFYVWLIHQNWNQLSSSLQSAVQNVGVSMSMAIGRSDAEVMVKTLGNIDPLRVKAEALTDHTQPLFHSVQEQWETQMHELTTLPNRHVKVRVGRQPTVEVVTLRLPQRRADPVRLEQIREIYRQKLLTPQHKLVLPHQQVASSRRQGTSTRRNSP